MRIAWIAILCGAGMLIAQDAEKEARRTKARELLDKVDLTVAAADPEVNVIALVQLAGAWRPLDAKRAVNYLQQAFASASALSDDDQRPRSRMQAEIVKAAVLIDLSEAAQLLRSMPATPGVDARLQAADAVVGALIDKKGYDQAMEALALTPADADYPFSAAQRLFEELPKDDSRRLLVFGNAAAAYNRHPGDGFGTFLAKHWKEVPRETAQAALASAVNSIRNREDEPGSGESLESTKGTIKLASKKSMDLFDLLGVIRALDPVRLKLLQEEYPDLREAGQKFPDGRQSMAGSEGMRTVANKSGYNSSYSSGSSGSSDDSDDRGFIPPVGLFADTDPAKLQETMRGFIEAQKKSEEALAAFDKDHNRGLSLADDIPFVSMRAELLIRFATALKKDPAAARNLLSKAQNLIGDIKYEGDRFGPSISVAELEHDLKSDDAAWKAMEQAGAALAAIYQSDSNAEHRNKALREFWPSTLMTRALMWKAVKLFGARAEELLGSMAGSDLVLMAQVELARDLLGASTFDAEHASMSWQVVH